MPTVPGPRTVVIDLHLKRRVEEAVETAWGRGAAQMHDDKDHLLEQVATTLAAATDQVDGGKAYMEYTADFIRDLKTVIEAHGLAAARRCLKLVPIAAAKGDSKAEIDLMLDRFDRGLMTNVFVSMDPTRRFPCEVRGTGTAVPQGLAVPSRRESHAS